MVEKPALKPLSLSSKFEHFGVKMRPLKFSNLKNFLLSRYIQLSNSLKIKAVEKNDTYLLKRKLTRTDFSKACARIFSTNAWHIVINNDAQLMEESLVML